TIGAEIVSMDSMALYRGMDIGTAKPTLFQCGNVPHHLIDLIEPHEEFSLAQYLEAARTSVDQIRTRGRDVLFVGGTPLYLKGLLRGVFEGPPADWDLRARLQEDAQRHDPGWLRQQLEAVDPVSAARLHPNDTRRLVRALEVYEKTGRPISELQQQSAPGRMAHQCRVFVLNWPPRDLHDRINRRVKEMFDAGLVDEVRALLGQPPSPGNLSRTARKAVGYREVIEHLDGKLTRPETIEAVQKHTRQLAKRQRTWFRGLSECRFVPVPGQIDPPELAQRIVAIGRHGA
ncbi:MAG: tRNA (adenosine(37)-N6)-dimethylallyltransferase MiaA, partial [Planctomycetes bacterium RBG_13_63_9]